MTISINFSRCLPSSQLFNDSTNFYGHTFAFEDRQLVFVPMFGTVYDAAVQTGVWSSGRIAGAHSCGWLVQQDFATPDSLAGAVWHWADNEPSNDLALNCTRMRVSDGRWLASACDIPRPHACVRRDTGAPSAAKTPQRDWTASRVAFAWALASGAVACPIGFEFSLPATSFGNAQLRATAAANGMSDVWLDYARVGNQWRAYHARDAGSIVGTATSSSTLPPQTRAPTMQPRAPAPPVPLRNSAGFPVTLVGGGTVVVPVGTVVNTNGATDREGNLATETFTNRIDTDASGRPIVNPSGVAATLQGNALPTAPPSNLTFVNDFKQSFPKASLVPPVVASLPAKPGQAENNNE